MKILFTLCEGPHDAQFIGRLLNESKKFTYSEKILKNYTQPLSNFIMAKIAEKSVQDLKIGKTTFPMVPICAVESIDKEALILPISMGGMDKYRETIDFIKDIENTFSKDVLEVGESTISDVSFLFIYDADDRGVDLTIQLFKERFKDHYQNIDKLSNLTWDKNNTHAISICILTDSGGKTGVLEDILLELFRVNNSALVSETEAHFQSHFPTKMDQENQLAHDSKKKKGVLATCGQMEKGNAGAALTVVVRDTTLLNGVFDFADITTQCSRLLKHIDEAFV